MISIRARDQAKWDAAGPALRKSAPRVKAFFEEVTKASVEEGAEALRGAIEGTDGRIALRMRQLTAAYARRKGSSSQLFNEGIYAASITAEGTGGRYTLAATGTHGPGGIPNADLANFLENGTRRMAPIPHWASAADFIKQRIRERIESGAKSVVRFR